MSRTHHTRVSLHVTNSSHMSHISDIRRHIEWVSFVHVTNSSHMGHSYISRTHHTWVSLHVTNSSHISPKSDIRRHIEWVSFVHVMNSSHMSHTHQCHELTTHESHKWHSTSYRISLFTCHELITHESLYMSRTHHTRVSLHVTNSSHMSRISDIRRHTEWVTSHIKKGDESLKCTWTKHVTYARVVLRGSPWECMLRYTLNLWYTLNLSC